MPGLVSTLLNQAYSMPGRLVQTFLQVTEHVWQPMHLSRLSTMPICARIFMRPPVVHAFERGRSCNLPLSLHGTDQLVGNRRVEPVDPAHLAHHDELVAVGADGSVVVEA